MSWLNRINKHKRLWIAALVPIALLIVMIVGQVTNADTSTSPADDPYFVPGCDFEYFEWGCD